MVFETLAKQLRDQEALYPLPHLRPVALGSVLIQDGQRLYTVGSIENLIRARKSSSPSARKLLNKLKNRPVRLVPGACGASSWTSKLFADSAMCCAQHWEINESSRDKLLLRTQKEKSGWLGYLLLLDALKSGLGIQTGKVCCLRLGCRLPAHHKTLPACTCHWH